jgi:hypothetical protein
MAPCDVLSATFRLALRLTFRHPSVPPFGVLSGFGGLSFPNCCQVAPPLTQGQYAFAKSRCSPHLLCVHPQAGVRPSTACPHVEAGRSGFVHGGRRAIAGWRRRVGWLHPELGADHFHKCALNRRGRSHFLSGRAHLNIDGGLEGSPSGYLSHRPSEKETNV